MLTCSVFQILEINLVKRWIQSSSGPTAFTAVQELFLTSHLVHVPVSPPGGAKCSLAI